MFNLTDQEREALTAILQWELDEERSASHKIIIRNILTKLETYDL